MGKFVKILWVTVVIAVSGCDDFDTASDSGNQPYTRYPIDRTITNSDGKSLQVTIVGRSDSALIFRKGDELKHYHYALDDLSKDDRKFARGLSFKVPTAPREPKNKLEKARVDGIVSSIERNIKRAKDLSIEEQDPSLRYNPMRQRSIGRKIKGVEWEINRLKEEYKGLTGVAYKSSYRNRFQNSDL